MFKQELHDLDKHHLLRTLVPIESAQGPHVVVQGRDMLHLCSNNYLGLAEHPAVRDAAIQALGKYGFGSGASRLVSGNMELHERLERSIATFKGTRSALLFNSGYAANTGIIPAIAGKGDLILSDSLNHASIIDGCRLSRANTFIYRHSDIDHAETLLRTHPSTRSKLIVTDGIFSMDGDIARLPDIVALAERYDALVMVDDAHATGILGRWGRGTVEHFGLEGRVHVQMGTLGKALGTYGAYATGDEDIIRWIMNKARSFVFSTSLPPAVCAASCAAFDILEHEPWRKYRLWQNRDYFANALTLLGINIGLSASPIIPLMIGDAETAVQTASGLFNAGIFAPAIRPPTVPDGSARIRTTIMATHTESDLDQAINVIKKLRSEGCFSDYVPL